MTNEAHPLNSQYHSEEKVLGNSLFYSVLVTCTYLSNYSELCIHPTNLKPNRFLTLNSTILNSIVSTCC